MINCKNKTYGDNVTFCERNFKMFQVEVGNVLLMRHNDSMLLQKENNLSSLNILRVPLILIFIVCSWYDNGNLEITMAGNFNGFVKCMFSAAEKDENSRNKGRLYDMETLGKH